MVCAVGMEKIIVQVSLFIFYRMLRIGEQVLGITIKFCNI